MDKENVPFDAFYQRVKAFKRSDEYCNYNHIYLDFEVIKIEDALNGEKMTYSFDNNASQDIKNPLAQNCTVQSSVIVVCPLCLENDEIKEREGDQLLF